MLGEQELEVGQSAFSTGKVTVERVLSKDVGNIPDVQWKDASVAYDFATKNMAATLATLGLTSRWVIDLVKFEIIRDFYQIIGLFFGGITWSPQFKTFFGNVFSIFSVNIPQIVSSATFKLAWFWVLVGLSQVFLLIFVIISCQNRSQDVVFALRAKHWVDRSKKYRLFVRIVGTILTTLFLPCAQAAVTTFVCDETWREAVNTPCYKGNYSIYLGFSALMFAGMVVYLPIHLYVIVSRNLPRIRQYDSEGMEQEYTDDLYKEDLRGDKSPYNFLYDGYERKWAHYKIFVLIMKLLLVLPVIVLSGTNIVWQNSLVNKIQLAIVIFVLLVYTVASFVSTPFLDPYADYLDMMARIAALLTAVAGLVQAFHPITIDGFGIALNVLYAVNVAFVIIFILQGSGLGNRMCARCCGRLRLTRARQNRKEELFFSDELNLLRERKKRVWHPFWDGLFLTNDQFKPPETQRWGFAQDTDDTPPYLQNFEGTVGERHIENKRIVEVVGFGRYQEAAARTSADTKSAANVIISDIFGVDSYYKTTDGGEQNYFGRTHVLPFPFTVVMLYDHSKNHVELSRPEEISLFMNQNCNSKEVLRLKDIRLRCRAVEGFELQYEHKATHAKSKSRTVTRNGKSQTEHYTVHVEFTWHHGIGQLKRHVKDMFETSDGSEVNLSAGFEFSVLLTDGTGVDREGKRWTGETEHLGENYWKIYAKEETAEFQRLMNHPSNTHVWENNVDKVRAHYQEARDHDANEFGAKRHVLTHEFWYHVYNSWIVTRGGVETYLQKYETNPILQSLARKHKAGLDLVYRRLEYFDAHPICAAWYVFWHDVWSNNSDMKAFKKNAATFDPASSSALCYRPCSREDLNKIMDDTTASQYIRRKTLDRLYERLNQILKGATDAMVVPVEFYISPLVLGGNSYEASAPSDDGTRASASIATSDDATSDVATSDDNESVDQSDDVASSVVAASSVADDETGVSAS